MSSKSLSVKKIMENPEVIFNGCMEKRPFECGCETVIDMYKDALYFLSAFEITANDLAIVSEDDI